MRDGGPRYKGKGARNAVALVNDTITRALRGCDPSDQRLIDNVLIDLDGTPNKSKLSANTIIGVSMAVAPIAVLDLGIPLYRHLGGPDARRLPIPMMNIINGGKHAADSIGLQEFMVMPVGAPTFGEALRFGAEAFHALAAPLNSKSYATTVGDEGGFAPPFEPYILYARPRLFARLGDGTRQIVPQRLKAPMPDRRLRFSCAG